MGAALEPGMFVECVNAAPCPTWGDAGLVERAIYRLRAVKRCRDTETGHAGDGVKLHGVIHPGGDGYWFGAVRFRPIYKPNSDLIQALLEPIEEHSPAPVKTREVA